MASKTSRRKKPWGGRFGEETSELTLRFTESISFDRRLASYDIRGSLAHAEMLARVGVLSKEEFEAIARGLSRIAAEIEQGEFNWSVELEDVHMNIETRLVELIGEAGKKLHTARSRNDQVATDLRLYLRDEIDQILTLFFELQEALLEKAKAEAETIMPGFTHLQVAQPVTFGHHLMAWFEMLLRDMERFLEVRRRVNVMPLGAAALAGTTFPIDRFYTAKLLGFDRPAANSLDAVSDRDFAVEFTHAAALTMMHLSRMAEEITLWMTQMFDFIDLPDTFCTGSSIMPQKRNPDIAELIRGKSGRIFGHLHGLLTLMKGQPLAYNRDNQEDKEPLFDTVGTLKSCLEVFAALVPEIRPKREKMLEAARRGFATATDLADYLVRKGVPFRDAHEIVGKAVRKALKKECDLADLPLEALQALCERIEEDVYEVLTLEGSVRARNHYGGTAPDQVRQSVQEGRKRLLALKTQFEEAQR